MSVPSLIRSILDLADCIDELTEAVLEQRDVVKSGNGALLQGTMKRVQDAFFRVQAQEVQRARHAEAVAGALGCAPELSALSAAVPESERLLFSGAGDRLKHAVFVLKSEMVILQSLIQQNERFSAMLLSEWRRLEGGFTRSAGLDFRG